MQMGEWGINKNPLLDARYAPSDVARKLVRR
jgi:hypothetical protein